MDMHFCDPNQLLATKQRNKLAAANKVLCFLPSRADRSKRTSAYTGFCDMRLFEASLRLFVRNVWLEIALKKQQRESEGEDAEAAIALRHERMRRIDPDFSRRPPQAKKIWAERRTVSITVGASWPQAVPRQT